MQDAKNGGGMTFEGAMAEISRLEAIPTEPLGDACTAAFCSDSVLDDATRAFAVPSWENAVADALRLERTSDSYRPRIAARSRQRDEREAETSLEARERAEIERMKAKFAAVGAEPGPAHETPARGGTAPGAPDGEEEGEEIALMRSRLAHVIEGEGHGDADAKAAPPAASRGGADANRARLEALKREIEERAKRRRVETSPVPPPSVKAPEPAVPQPAGAVTIDQALESRRRKVESLKQDMKDFDNRVRGAKAKPKDAAKQAKAGPRASAVPESERERRLSELMRRLKELEEE